MRARGHDLDWVSFWKEPLVGLQEGGHVCFTLERPRHYCKKEGAWKEREDESSSNNSFQLQHQK